MVMAGVFLCLRVSLLLLLLLLLHVFAPFHVKRSGGCPDCCGAQSTGLSLEQRANLFSPRFIPSTWRPPIWVRVLPALENIFYGANLSNILSAHTSTFLSIMAWLPYGIIHFGAPVVCSTIMFIFAAPGTVPMFAKSFGWMNLIGVAIQLTFPCSPPWYENMYGLAPANYSIHGSPAGLAAIDKLFGIALYTPGFTGSPMVFGAFPSLHAGSAVMEALFMSHVFPRLTPLFALYTLWLWWATMYLSHHYAVDLVGGSLRGFTRPFPNILAYLL